MAIASSDGVSYFLIVERPENWAVDKETGFSQFGIPRTRASIGSAIRAEDILITYVSGGVSRIADCRRVTAGGLVPRTKDVPYKSVFPWFILTEPLIALSEEEWIPIREMLERLEFAKGITNWRQLFRTSVRRLSATDGYILCEELKRRQDGRRKMV